MVDGACPTRHVWTAMRPVTRALCWLVLSAVVLLSAPSPAVAQSTTATIQGTVSDDTGVLPGATISARETEGGFSFEAVTGPEGGFVLAGLRPGTYERTVVMDKYKPQTQTVRVLVGQAVTANFRITPDLLYVEEVTVVGDRLVDTRTSEITTNVTEEQIRYLPQNSRNFLNFAALAPGVRLSTDEFRQEVTSGGLASRSTNVFIDGVSYKNDVIEGGVIGQDASRGNPFPQNAVQEFQVLTQNFKAEYEKATSAIITAVTKSGTNRFSGDIFNFYQDKSLVENQAVIRDATSDLYVVGKTEPKPVFERWPWGASLGGPIIRDKTWFFGAFEENRQDRASQVFMGTVVGAPPPASLVESLRPYEGQFTSPFRERLLFAKGSWQPKAGQQVEVTYNWRNETDIRGFGNQGANAQTSFEAAENVRNRVDSLMGKYQMAGATFVNEVYASYQRYRWNPGPENPDVIGQDYQGLLKIGGRDTTQRIVQERYTFRDDYTRFAQWRGSHAMKVGGVVSFLDYAVNKQLFGNPLFRYRTAENFAFPFEASYGVGDPDLSDTNRQFGIYAQDDWAITPRFTLNLGLRWDVETNMLNSDYVTPDDVRAAAAPFVDASRYLTDGDDRSPFYGAVQPRVGFSLDVLGTGRTILFGGYGRYYDRVLYNHTLDERSRLQYAVRLFRFSADGAPRDGNRSESTTLPAPPALPAEPAEPAMKSRPLVTSIAILALGATVVVARAASDDVDERDEALLARMTLAEKLGQLQQLDGHADGKLREEHLDLARKGLLGSTLNVRGAKIVNELQRAAVEQSRLKIPLLFAFDVIHGYRTIFPIPLGEAAAWDPAAAERAAAIAAAESKAVGLHWTFAPMVDIARDARWGRIAEGAGEDPYLGSVLARARVRGFQGNDYSAPDKVMATAKHWVAYGAAEAGRDYNTTDLSEHTLRTIYFPPFKAALDAARARS